MLKGKLHSKHSRKAGSFGRSVDSVPSVYFISTGMAKNAKQASHALEVILTHREYWLARMFRDGDLVGIKPGAGCASELTDFILETARAFWYAKACPFVCDTSDRHLSLSQNGVRRVRDLLAEGIGNENVTLPVLPMDGIMGEYEFTAKQDKRILKGVSLAGELANIAGVVSLSIVRPHDRAGISGSMTNIGTGFASKKGKICQLTVSPPVVNPDKCYRCKRCIRECPVQAIRLADDAVKIDGRRCVKCGKCVEVAHYGGITFDWNATKEHYQKALCDYISSALAVFYGRVICVNIVFAREGSEKKEHFKGAFVSRDPVAADAAVLDFMQKKKMLGEKACRLTRQTLERGQAEDAGSSAYRLIEVAY